MSCREYQHQIVLFLYEELPDDERAGMEAHLRECSACQQSLEEHKSLHLALNDEDALWDAPADLLLESRKMLSDQLDRIERKRAWWHIPTFSVVFTPMRMLESAALVAMGLALGVYVARQQISPLITPSIAESQSLSMIPRNATVANVRIVDANAATGEVQLSGEVIQPLRLQGNMDDETVRRLTLSALGDGANAHSRIHAVEALAKKPANSAVKEALIQALVSDEVPAVRAKALEALIPFAGEPDVQMAFVHAMQNDHSESIRANVIEALMKFSKDQSLVNSVKEVTKEDESPYVRAKALQFVGNHQ
jgi:anti-sigma factor RsiW